MRAGKDSFYLNLHLEVPEHSIAMVGYINDKPVSIALAGINGKTASIVLNKTLCGYQDATGEILGRRGVTEACYLGLCDAASKRDIEWLNDGDSPPGSGAEKRKSSWSPVAKIDSFKLTLI